MRAFAVLASSLSLVLFGCTGGLVREGDADSGVISPGDGSVADASTEEDAGELDGSTSDPDAGMIADSGSDDAGVEPDGGVGVDGGPMVPPDFRSSDNHVARPIGFDGSPRGFYEYLPPFYDPTGGPGSPLMLFFHGLGENGDGTAAQLDRVLRAGPPLFIERDEWPGERPFIVLSSQQAVSCPTAADVDGFLTWARANYHVDDRRIYLTGLSCGGIAIDSYLRVHADTTDVAAVVPISGRLTQAWDGQMCDLGRIAIWGIAGELDMNPPTNPDYTRIPMESLIACSPRRDARVNILPGVGHDGGAWNATYSGANGLDIYTWMLDNAR